MVKIKRYWFQITSLLLGNSYLKGFLEGTIYTGNLKKICFPGLNCYSCPGAVGSCPIGSMQAIALDIRFKFSLYIAGILIFIGTLIGRAVCGWICPFGFFQDILYKTPFKKIKIHKLFEKLKYVILLVTVILLPALYISFDIGSGSPYFCKFICPAGTLEAGIPLAIANERIRSTLGLLFTWKMALLIGVIILSMASKRPFCRVVCPLGAIYSVFNKISFYRMEVSKSKCTRCGSCKSKCPVDHTIYENPNGLECIRCGNCKKNCPAGAIKSYFGNHELNSNSKCDKLHDVNI
ncbi:MAG TPA: 4Fe-4S binding protein [Pseudobacteroides sp.]|uniref:4Fe-4S binding protein n=1 Tax=Pseudobacteroides sp. TaxID=1968840 RepID=UPI002F933AD9